MNQSARYSTLKVDNHFPNFPVLSKLQCLDIQPGIQVGMLRNGIKRRKQVYSLIGGCYDFYKYKEFHTEGFITLECGGWLARLLQMVQDRLDRVGRVDGYKHYILPTLLLVIQIDLEWFIVQLCIPKRLQ